MPLDVYSRGCMGLSLDHLVCTEVHIESCPTRSSHDSAHLDVHNVG